MEQNKESDLSILSKVLKLAVPYRGIGVFCVIAAVLIAPISNIRPFIISKMVDEHVMMGNLAGLKTMALIYLGIVVATVFLRYSFIYYSWLLGQSVIRDLRIKVFNHVSSLKLNYFDKTPIGKITTRTINDVQAVNEIFTQGVLNIAADIMGIFAIIGFMLYTSWRLTLICILTLPLMVIATYVFKEKVKKAFKKVRNQITNMNAFLNEQITGMQVVQIFNSEKREAAKFKAINRKYTKANIDTIEYYAIFFPVVELISSLALALLVWYGSKGIWEHNISVGAFISFPMYLSMLFRPVRMLADKLNTLQMGLVAASRVFDVLENDNKIEDTGDIVVDKIDGEIAFSNIWFAYNNEEWILKDVSFTLDAGQTLAIVGSTGSGKTTIINLLNRFYEIQKGKIKIDKTNIREYKLESLRSRLSMVLQDVFLFNGTVYENIGLKDNNITLDKVIEASKSIGAHRFIMDLPDDYNFKISERGSNLSMGQRQLISFVRALVFDPDILILDEATSSIDSETESIIQYAIEKLIEKRTSIIIAHRLSTIKHADKILVMDNGQIKEAGNHSELLEKGGAYKKLYEKQFSQAATVL